MIPLLGNVVENKKIVPTNQDPKINQERSHRRFRPLLTNGCSGRRVGEAGGRSGSSRSRSPTNSPSIYPTNKSLKLIFREEEEAPQRRIKVMIPLPVSTHPVEEIQQRSSVQRRTPPRKLERENPNEFRSRLESKPGSNCGATSN